MACDPGTSRNRGRFACLFLLLPALLLADQDNPANFDLNLQFEPELVGEVEIEMLCNAGEPRRQRIQATLPGIKRLNLNRFNDREPICQVRALVVDGYEVEYQSASEDRHKADEHGCHFMTVSRDQIYACRINIVQIPVPLVVYKKWVGASGHEPGVAIQLVCGERTFAETRLINRNVPGGWEVGDINVDGQICDVHEKPGDTFIADESDCQGLMLLPGRGAECTMVNTKIVKRIEMLNRYGIAIMILVMLVAGLVAVRRYV